MKLYGSPLTRAHRTIWMLEELALEVELIPAVARTKRTTHPPADRETLLALTPTGRVPILVDGDLVLCESLAINLYLATAHPSDLTPATPSEWGLAQQWTTWAASELDPPAMAIAQALAARDPDTLSPDEKEATERESALLQRRLAPLETTLCARDWLAADRFTVADLNVASTLVPCLLCELDLGFAPRTTAWLDRCLERPAAERMSSQLLVDAAALE